MPRVQIHQSLLCLLLILVMSSTAFAQKLYLSEKENFNYRNDEFEIVGKRGPYYLAYLHRDEERKIHFYNDKMVKEKTLDLDVIPANAVHVRFVCAATHLLVFYEIRENKKQQLFGTRLLENNTWAPPVLIDSRSSNIMKEHTPYYMTVSDNQEKVLIYNVYFSNGEQILHAEVLDRQLQELKIIKQVFKERVYYYSERSAISNAGVPYIAVSDKPSSRGSVEDLKLLSSRSFQNEFTLYTYNLQKYAVSDWWLKVDNNNQNLYLAGFFADSRLSNSRGIYFSVFDEEKQAETTSHFLPLALQIVSSKTDLKDLRIRNFMLRRDGGIEIAAEKTYQNTRSVSSISPLTNTTFITGPDNSRTVTEFSYDEIFIFNLKTDGSLAWSQTILKEQTTTDDGGIFSSFALLQYPIGNAYIFNDLSTRTSRLLVCYVSSKGELNMKELPTNEQVDEWNPMPRSGKQVSKSEMLIPCVIKNQISFLKISY